MSPNVTKENILPWKLISVRSSHIPLQEGVILRHSMPPHPNSGILGILVRYTFYGWNSALSRRCGYSNVGVILNMTQVHICIDIPSLSHLSNIHGQYGWQFEIKLNNVSSCSNSMWNSLKKSLVVHNSHYLYTINAILIIMITFFFVCLFFFYIFVPK